MGLGRCGKVPPMPPFDRLRRLLPDLPRRRTLWWSALAVFVPLAVMLGLQYRWLADLEAASALAWRAARQSFLEVVAGKVEGFYRGQLDNVLNLPAVVALPAYREKAERVFAKKPVPAAKRLFLVSFTEPKARIEFFDPASQKLVPASEGPEFRAIWHAASPWIAVAYKGAAMDLSRSRVDERDPQHRILLRPLVDDGEKLVGLTGMILDEDHFRATLLPELIAAARPLLPAEAGEVAVEVVDGGGRRVWPANAEPMHQAAGGDRISRAFPLVFTDWRVVVEGRVRAPETLARANFLVNLGLSVLLSVALLAGVLMLLRATARELRLTEMKNDFVSNVSHELRTPLASIRVFGELLRLGRVSKPEKVREYGETIEAESRRLTQLINNILDFSRIESGQRAYHFEAGDLEAVVADVVELFELRLAHSGFRLSFEPPREPLPPLAIDAGAIEQAISNLLDNAVKYSGEGRQVTVGLGRQGNDAVLWVEDQGIGISRDEQGKIFDRFHRVSTGLVHDVKGSGLGLSIVDHVVRAHGGKVEVASELGRGSRFSLLLPLPEEPPEDQATAPRLAVSRG